MSNLSGLYDENANTAGDFEPLPAGIYTLELIESDIAATSAGTGKLFKYKASVVEGERKESLVFGQMNLQNPNPTATKIGQEEFASLRLVTGTPSPEDTADLHFRAFQAVVKVEPAKKVGDKEYGPRNAIDWGKTTKLFKGEEVKVPGATANDNAAPAKTAANDNAEKPAAAAKPAGGAKKGAWPRKAA
jgi:hypothetical protein